MKHITFILLPLLLMLLLSCQSDKPIPVFNLEGSSVISVVNKTNDSLKINIENWYAVPMKEQVLDTMLMPSDSLSYTLKAQGKQYYTMDIGGAKHRMFIQPNSNDAVIVTNAYGSDSIVFSGSSEKINRFLLNKTKAFASADADWMPRAEATHNAKSFRTVISVNDSVTEQHITYVRQHAKQVPEWYTDFEIDRLEYLNEQFKINSFAYRRVMLGKEDSLPPDFLSRLNVSVQVDNPEMLGNMSYTQFLSDYIAYKTDSSFSSQLPTSKEAWQNRYNNLFATANKELTGLVQDFYLTSSISKIIDSRSYVLDTNWIGKVNNQGLQDFLHHYLATHEVLPEGANVPYFNLQGLNGLYYEPKQFQNRILLINFWATWCKPCIQEFPDENSLVKKFNDEPVIIVNICIDSDIEKWKELVEKHALKTLNLIAQDKWNDVLSEKFDISALPHSVLIDGNGQVVQNKCPRASEGIDIQIAELLHKINTGAGSR